MVSVGDEAYIVIHCSTEMFGLQGPESYMYTSGSKTLDVASINDVADYAETQVIGQFTINENEQFSDSRLLLLQKAMQVIGLTDGEQTSIFRVLSTILWLGNVTFKEKDDGNADIADTDVTDFVAYLMETNPDQVVKVLTTRVVETQRGGRRGKIVVSAAAGSSLMTRRPPPRRIYIRRSAQRISGVCGSRCACEGIVGSPHTIWRRLATDLAPIHAGIITSLNGS